MTELSLSAFDISPEEFRRRVEWARSRGSPTWLWPDIPIDGWRDAREMVTRALREVLTHGSSETLLVGDARTIGLAAYTAGIGPLLGWWIAEGRIQASSSVAAVLDIHLQHCRTRMDRLRSQTTEIVGSLADRGIAATILKGMHTAFIYFPDPATRPSSDIDLSIRIEDTAAADQFLQDRGFALKNRTPRAATWAPSDLPAEPASLMLAHACDPWSVDLHCSLDYKPSPTVAATRLDEIDDALRRLRWPGGPAGLTLSQPLLLLHLAAHASSVLENLTPLRMAEIALVVRRDLASGDLQWDAFLDLGHRAAALGIVFPALYFAEKLAPKTIPTDVLQAIAAETPAAVRRHLAAFSPASVQVIDRFSVRERFMWSEGWRARSRRLAHSVAPTLSPGWLYQRYRRLGMLLVRRQFTK